VSNGFVRRYDRFCRLAIEARWRSLTDCPRKKNGSTRPRNGDKDNLYPWGNTWSLGHAATLDAGVGKEQTRRTYPAGANRWGVQDLIG